MTLFPGFAVFLLVAMGAHLLANTVASVYQTGDRYPGLGQVLPILNASLVTMLALLVWWSSGRLLRTVPLTVVMVGSGLAMVFMMVTRLPGRLLLNRSRSQRPQ